MLNDREREMVIEGGNRNELCVRLGLENVIL